jgi:hypothetical protein
MRKPIIQLSIDVDMDFISKRSVNRLTCYVSDYYQQNFPNLDYGNIRKILIVISEDGENRIWESSKVDPILTLYYKANLKDLESKDVCFYNDLLLNSLNYHSKFLPDKGEYVSEIHNKFAEVDFKYAIQKDRKRSTDRKYIGFVQIEMTPDKAVYFCIREDQNSQEVDRIELVETTPFLFSIAGIVEKVKWISKNEILILSKIGVQFKVDFDHQLCTLEFEGSERRKKLAEIELTILLPYISFEEIVQLQAEMKSLLFGQ